MKNNFSLIKLNFRSVMLFLILLIFISQISTIYFSVFSTTKMTYDSIFLGDFYANEVERYITTSNPDRAIGPPDGNFSRIFEDYQNGYITLDMGYHEEIIDNTGDDFKIIAREGGYRVRISNNLSTFPVDIGSGLGNQSFDLNSIGYESARYVIVEYKNGTFVDLDAIEAYYITEIETENDSPTIETIEDFWVWKNQSQIELLWIVYDENPWNYSIFVNNSLIKTEEWDGENISFTYEIQTSGNLIFSLNLYDLFGNYHIESVRIEIKEVDTPIPTKTNYVFTFTLTIYFFFVLYLKLNKIRRKIKKK